MMLEFMTGKHCPYIFTRAVGRLPLRECLRRRNAFNCRIDGGTFFVRVGRKKIWLAKYMSIEVRGVKKSYGNFSVSLDFSVNKGETLALVGPSGSGKTTALNLISGISTPEEGKIIVDGEDISNLPVYRRNISVVFQDIALFPHLDVGGNIAYGLFVRKIRRKERQRIVEETLNTVHLSGYARRRVDTLSGGEKQRVAIARALASMPRALLLDEPFSSLDAPLRKEMRREFLEIRSRSDAPCVFVTHDREEAAIVADRVARCVLHIHYIVGIKSFFYFV